MSEGICFRKVLQARVKGLSGMGRMGREISGWDYQVPTEGLHGGEAGRRFRGGFIMALSPLL